MQIPLLEMRTQEFFQPIHNFSLDFFRTRSQPFLAGTGVGMDRAHTVTQYHEPIR